MEFEVAYEFDNGDTIATYTGESFAEAIVEARAWIKYPHRRNGETIRVYAGDSVIYQKED